MSYYICRKQIMKTYAFQGPILLLLLHQRNNQVAIDSITIKELWKSGKVFSQGKIVEEINDGLIA